MKIQFLETNVNKEPINSKAGEYLLSKLYEFRELIDASANMRYAINLLWLVNNSSNEQHDIPSISIDEVEQIHTDAFTRLQKAEYYTEKVLYRASNLPTTNNNETSIINLLLEHRNTSLELLSQCQVGSTGYFWCQGRLDMVENILLKMKIPHENNIIPQYSEIDVCIKWEKNK